MRTRNYFLSYTHCVGVTAFAPNEAILQWNWDSQQEQYIVEAKFSESWPSQPGGLFQLCCRPKSRASDPSGQKSSGKLPVHRYPSGADITLLVDNFVNQGEEDVVSINVTTEDDILHLRNLPTFDSSITTSDSELLLSYLTEPYLRIPLVIQFFATEDRIHSLKSPELRELLDSVLFEPG